MMEPRVTTVSLTVKDTVVSANDRPVSGVLTTMVVMMVVTPAAAVIITGGNRRARSSTGPAFSIEARVCNPVVLAF